MAQLNAVRSRKVQSISISEAMTRPFVKMNGAATTSVVVNALETPFAPTADQARAIADRKTGEGCDS